MARLLGIVDRAYRGALEAQYFDVVHGFRYFREQLGSADLLLRGTAVTLAVDEDVYRPTLDVGPVHIETLPDYRGGIRAALTEGASVLVDEEDLRAVGIRPDQLIPGVTCLDTTQFAAKWPTYDEVWFV